MVRTCQVEEVKEEVVGNWEVEKEEPIAHSAPDAPRRWRTWQRLTAAAVVVLAILFAVGAVFFFLAREPEETHQEPLYFTKKGQLWALLPQETAPLELGRSDIVRVTVMESRDNTRFAWYDGVGLYYRKADAKEAEEVQRDVRAAALSPSGNSLLYYVYVNEESGGKLCRYDGNSGEVQELLTGLGNLQYSVISQDGAYWALQVGDVLLWANVETGEIQQAASGLLDGQMRIRAVSSRGVYYDVLSSAGQNLYDLMHWRPGGSPERELASVQSLSLDEDGQGYGVCDSEASSSLYWFDGETASLVDSQVDASYLRILGNWDSAQRMKAEVAVYRRNGEEQLYAANRGKSGPLSQEVPSGELLDDPIGGTPLPDVILEGNSLYCMTGEFRGDGEVWRVPLEWNGPGSPEKLESFPASQETWKFYVTSAGDVLRCGSSREEGERESFCSLYWNGEQAADDLYLWGGLPYQLFEYQGAVYYMGKGRDQGFSMKRIQKGVSEMVDDTVEDCRPMEDGRLAYLRTGEGETQDLLVMGPDGKPQLAAEAVDVVLGWSHVVY